MHEKNSGAGKSMPENKMKKISTPSCIAVNEVAIFLALNLTRLLKQ